MKTSELYRTVTAQVIKDLEEGTPPWTKPWKDGKMRGVGMMPSNLITGRLYSGGNVLLLWMSAQMKGYENLQFCTYNQVNGIGAKVKKGERATHIIFTKHVTRKDEDTEEERPGTVVKSYPVFHLSQLQDVPDRYTHPQEGYAEPVFERETAVQFVRGTGIRIEKGANKAAYYPVRDEIVMPHLSVFESEDAYWGVLNHELTHATGHENRLKRVFGKRFADSAYSFEELVAELGSAFLCARLGIPPSFRSSSYIQNWLTVLQSDTRAIFTAASYAGQAADWLWKRSYGDENEQRQAAE